MGKRECLIAGDHYAIAAIECLPGSAHFVDPVFGQSHVLGQSNFYPYKFFLGRGQATFQVKVFPGYHLATNYFDLHCRYGY